MTGLDAAVLLTLSLEFRNRQPVSIVDNFGPKQTSVDLKSDGKLDAESSGAQRFTRALP